MHYMAQRTHSSWKQGQRLFQILVFVLNKVVPMDLLEQLKMLYTNKEPCLHQNLQHFSELILPVILVLPSFVPKIDNANSGLQFIMCKERTSMKEVIESQGQLFLSSWHGYQTIWKSQGQTIWAKKFCTLEKKKPKMAFNMLHFPEPLNYKMLVLLVALC